MSLPPDPGPATDWPPPGTQTAPAGPTPPVGLTACRPLIRKHVG